MLAQSAAIRLVALRVHLPRHLVIAVKLRPGTMTLVLANPGGGSSTLLKLLSARIQPTNGAVTYNGTAVPDLAETGVDARRLAAYIDQTDVHEPLFTVRETFEVRNVYINYRLCTCTSWWAQILLMLRK